MVHQTERLLRHDPTTAVLIMANNAANLHMRREFVAVSDPVMVSGLSTRVSLTSKPSDNPYWNNNYVGQSTFTYNRLSVSEMFDGIKIPLHAPVTVHGVLRYLALRTGMYIAKTDFVNDRITSTSFTLAAHPQSLRWVGSATLTLLDPEDETPHLALEFPKNILDGLWVNGIPWLKDEFDANILNGLNVRKMLYFDELFRNRILDGLTAPGEREFSEVAANQVLDGLNKREAPLFSELAPNQNLAGLRAPEYVLFKDFAPVQILDGLNKPLKRDFSELAPNQVLDGLNKPGKPKIGEIYREAILDGLNNPSRRSVSEVYANLILDGLWDPTQHI